MLFQDIYFQPENRYKTNISSVREAMFTDSLNLGYRYFVWIFSFQIFTYLLSRLYYQYSCKLTIGYKEINLMPLVCYFINSVTLLVSLCDQENLLQKCAMLTTLSLSEYVYLNAIENMCKRRRIFKQLNCIIIILLNIILINTPKSYS